MLLPFFKFFDEARPQPEVSQARSELHSEPTLTQEFADPPKKDKHVVSTSTVATDWIDFAESSSSREVSEMAEKDKRVFSTLTEVTVSGDTLRDSSERNSQVIQPKKWPQQPQSLGGSFLYEFGLTLYDIFLCLLPIGLLIKAGLCIKANQRDGKLNEATFDYASPLTLRLIKFNEQLVTAFTIIFVTIMTTMIRRYALWKAQRGAYVSDLEQMQGSISLPSTLKMAFVLRKFTFFSFGLFAVWSFYYLGSQASTREYTFALTNATRPVKAAYPIWQQYPFTWANQSRDDLDGTNKEIWNSFTTSYEALNDPSTDLDGNVLIPMMRWSYVDAGTEVVQVNADGTPRTWEQMLQWTDVHTNQEDFTAVKGRKLALWGNDIYQNNDHDHWELYLHKIVGTPRYNVSYLQVNCHTVTTWNGTKLPEGAYEPMHMTYNYTQPSNESSSELEQTMFDVWYRWNNATYDAVIDADWNFDPPVIDGYSEGMLQITCNITQPQMTVELACDGLHCKAHKAKYLPISNEELYKTPFRDQDWGKSFFDNLLWMSGEPDPAQYSWTQPEYQTGIDLYFLPFMATGSNHDYTGMVSYDEVFGNFSYAITKLFNTYANVAENNNINYIGEGDYFNYGPTEFPEEFYHFKFKSALYRPHYQLRIEWITIDFVSCTILLAAALFSFWLRRNTLAPEMFGFVSEVTRDNKNIHIADGGSGLSGYDRARRMKDVKIKIGDVSSNPEVGRVGIVAADQNVPSLSKSKVYL